MRRAPRIAVEVEAAVDGFARLLGDAWWDHHFDGGRWTEGPLYVPAGRYLIFSDIPNDRNLRWDENSGLVSEFSGSANHSNGRTLDRSGRVVTCEQGTRSVVRVEHDGSRTIIADRVGGSRFNSPNDVVVRSDGSIWFTDPSYGIDSDYEGHRSEPEIDGCHVYRVAEDSGAVEAVADDFAKPNGLAFSVDERRLYIVDSHHDHIRRFDVNDDATLSGGDVIAESSAGHFDGIRVDTAGRIWAAAADGVHCLDPDGALLGKIQLPEPASNVAFGGARRNELFVTATRSLYSTRLKVNGI